MRLRPTIRRRSSRRLYLGLHGYNYGVLCQAREGPKQLCASPTGGIAALVVCQASEKGADLESRVQVSAKFVGLRSTHMDPSRPNPEATCGP